MVKKSRIARKPPVSIAADAWVGAGGIDPEIQVSSSINNSSWDFTLIQEREDDTRDLNQSHVLALADSITILGLIEPLVIDEDGRLLAGGHRHAAIALLAEENPETYTELFPDHKVPVRIMGFSSAEDPNRAIEIEISENELRRDYSKAEVLAIAEKLRDAGYKDTPGRPRKGEKRLKPALSTIFGKSIRTVERYLAEKTPTNGEVSKSGANIHLKRAIPHLRNWNKTRGRSQAEQALSKKLQEIITLMEEVAEKG